SGTVVEQLLDDADRIRDRRELIVPDVVHRIDPGRCSFGRHGRQVPPSVRRTGAPSRGDPAEQVAPGCHPGPPPVALRRPNGHGSSVTPNPVLVVKTPPDGGVFTTGNQVRRWGWAQSWTLNSMSALTESSFST